MEVKMEKHKIHLIITFVILATAGLTLLILTPYLFKHNVAFRELFSGADSAGLGTVGPESEESLMQSMEFAGKVSMWIFVFITLLQLIAFWVGFAVVSGIKNSQDPVKLQLRNLDNAEVFFDVPLYFGLFGTVSAFLVMTFSPQSSRLIAYSSTLIGIIFSLVLRLTLQYPLRRSLVRLDTLQECKECNAVTDSGAER